VPCEETKPKKEHLNKVGWKNGKASEGEREGKDKKSHYNQLIHNKS
jgi:hypothetical protein